MNQIIELIKGIHPGVYLARELQKRKLAKGRFALSVNEYPQTLGDITKGKRKMNVSLALKIERALGLEEGFLMILQTYYDIKQVKMKLADKLKPIISVFRPALFWDTSINKINWLAQKEAILKRVMERGNELEKKEIIRFYNSPELQNLLPNE